MIAAGELHSILALAQRDLTKLLRDRARLITTVIFPFIFIGALGGTLSANFGRAPGFDFLTLTFTGVYAQTLFQSTAMGMISLVIDRENDFSQELFIAPVSRYTIIAGRILGETLVALPQAAQLQRRQKRVGRLRGLGPHRGGSSRGGRKNLRGRRIPRRA